MVILFVRSRLSRMMVVGSLCLSLGVAAALAGELRVAWNASSDRQTAGYRVLVGTEPGAYTAAFDAGNSTSFLLKDLEDDRLLFIAVRTYDSKRRDSGSLSPELASLPRPQIVSIEPALLRPGQSEYVTLRGVNIGEGAQVRVSDPHLAVRSVVDAGPDAVLLLLGAAPAAAGSGADPIPLAPSSFTVINPGRKADTFFRSHPEALDLDGDHLVGDRDLEIVRRAFGAHRGEPGYSAAADLDDDGAVDGHDLARLISRMAAQAAPSGTSN